MKILFCPKDSGNPYQSLLSRELQSLGVDVVYYHKLPENRWLMKNRHTVQVLHLHWPHTSYYRGRSLVLRIISLLWFAQRLFLARFLGYKLVWTVHNIVPHETSCPVVDFAARLFLSFLAHDVIAHCGYAKTKIKEKFGRKKDVHVIPHGNYLNVYPPKPSKNEARKTLSIAQESFVYLFFGNIRPYKGVEQLISAFRQLDDEKTVLILAGRCLTIEESEVVKLIKDTERIRLFTGFVPPEKLPVYFAAADCVVAPFTNVLTSGSVILGLSFGQPIVAPALGCLPELLTAKTGELYDPAEKNSLLNALQKILNNKKINDTAEMSFHVAKGLGWPAIAKKTQRVYFRSF